MTTNLKQNILKCVFDICIDSLLILRLGLPEELRVMNS